MEASRRDSRSRWTMIVQPLRWRYLPALAAAAVIAVALAIPAPTAREPTTSAGSSPAASEPQAPSAAQPPADPAAPTPAHVQAGDGSLFTVPDGSAPLGTGGPLITFDVLIEGGLGLDGTQFAGYVEQILADPRGWGAGGQRTFQRTSDGQAAVHIMLISPQRVESYCPGYGTGGYTSCRYQDRVVVNLERWSVGVPDYDGYLWNYRQYVINHEMGHFLGFGHVPCPGAGQKAPVMMQQTLGLNGCAANPWPYPNSPADDPTSPA